MKELIEKLSEGKTCKGCQGCTCDSDILIGDVLAKIDKNWLEAKVVIEHQKKIVQILELIKFWGFCGHTKSLQEIAKDYKHNDCIVGQDCYCIGILQDQLKPEAQALKDFLTKIFDEQK